MTGQYMTDDKEVAGLLQESIDAQNRTTHAVRAFVRFFFIQLVAVTIASPLVYFGTILDALGLVLIALGVLGVGIVWSSYAGWTELGRSDRFTVVREEARELRHVQAEAERGKAAIVRETEAIARRDARRELFASRRFRVRALTGAGVALAAISIGAVFLVISAADRATQLENLPETYLRAVNNCASTAGAGNTELGSRYSIKDATLSLKYELGLYAGPGDGFVDCVVSALTGDGASDISRGISQERGFLTVSRSETGAILTVMPTP
jgi:hypothetical protein